jgi:hypothetical protein
MNLFKLQCHLQRGAAYLVAPVLRVTGLRFSKAWRGNGVVDHIAANVLADGGTPFPLREFNF